MSMQETDLFVLKPWRDQFRTTTDIVLDDRHRRFTRDTDKTPMLHFTAERRSRYPGFPKLVSFGKNHLNDVVYQSKSFSKLGPPVRPNTPTPPFGYK